MRGPLPVFGLLRNSVPFFLHQPLSFRSIISGSQSYSLISQRWLRTWWVVGFELCVLCSQIWPLWLTTTLCKFLDLGEPQFSICRRKEIIIHTSRVGSAHNHAHKKWQVTSHHDVPLRVTGCQWGSAKIHMSRQAFLLLP